MMKDGVNSANRSDTLTLIYFMYLIDHVAELRFVNRFIYAIKRIYTHSRFSNWEDLQEELPLHVSLVTRARTYTTDRNTVVASNSDPNDSNTKCSFTSDDKCR